MKNGTYNLMMGLVAALAITACGSKGSSNVASTPATAYANGVCTVDVNGTCVGGTPYTGYGEWRGTLVVAADKLALFQQYLIDNNLCETRSQGRNRYHQNRQRYCDVNNTSITVSSRLNGNSGRLVLGQLNQYGSSSNSRRATINGLAYANNGALGFLIVSQGNLIQNTSYNAQVLYGDQGQGGVQLSAVATDASLSIVTTQLFYRNVLLASGQLQRRY